MKRIALLVVLLAFALLANSAEPGNRIPAKGFAVFSQGGQFAPYEFTRHALGDDDVLICHRHANS